MPLLLFPPLSPYLAIPLSPGPHMGRLPQRLSRFYTGLLGWSLGHLGKVFPSYAGHPVCLKNMGDLDGPVPLPSTCP